MSTSTVACSRPDRHAAYRQSDGSCWVCTQVANWPEPTDEQVEVLRRCLPPLTPEEIEAARYASSSRRAAA